MKSKSSCNGLTVDRPAKDNVETLVMSSVLYAHFHGVSHCLCSY